MESVVFSGDSKKDLKELTDLAEKLGLEVKWLSEGDIEDLGLSRAIREGKTGESIDTNEFLDSLSK